MRIGKILFIVASIAQILWIVGMRAVAGFFTGGYLGFWVALITDTICYGFLYAVGLDDYVLYLLPFGALVWAVCALGTTVFAVASYNFKLAYADFLKSLARKH